MSLKDFEAKVKSDSALAAKVEAAETAEQVVEIAKAAGYNVSVEDFEKLSDDDLDNVAGGKSWLKKQYDKLRRKL